MKLKATIADLNQHARDLYLGPINYHAKNVVVVKLTLNDILEFVFLRINVLRVSFNDLKLLITHYII